MTRNTTVRPQLTKQLTCSESFDNPTARIAELARSCKKSCSLHRLEHLVIASVLQVVTALSGNKKK